MPTLDEIRNRHLANMSNIDNAFNNYSTAKDDEEEERRKQLQKMASFYSDKIEKREKKRENTDKFNFLKNMSEMSSQGKLNNKPQSIIQNPDYYKAFNSNGLMMEAKRNYDEKQAKKKSSKDKNGNININDFDPINKNKNLGNFMESHPTIKNITQGVNDFIGGFGSGVTFGDKKYEMKNPSTAYKAGEFGSYLVPDSLPNLIFKGGEKLATKALIKAGVKEAEKVTTKGAKGVIKKLALSGVKGTAGMGGLETTKEAKDYTLGNKDLTGENLKESIKNTAIRSAIGGGFNMGLTGLGMAGKGIIGKIANKYKPNSINPTIETEKLTQEIPKISKSKYSSALDYHNKMFDEYKTAENNWENAVNNVKDIFGKNRILTNAEQNFVKSEMGMDKLANEYELAQNNYLKAKEALNKSVSRQSAKSNSITDKYGLNQDISSLSEAQQKDAYKKSLLNVLEDSGTSIKNKLKTDNPFDVVKHYENKYNLKPIQVVKSNTTNTNPAKIFINKDKAGNVIGARLEINDIYNRNQQLGAIRHEIEHLKDVQEGFTPSEIGSVKDVKTLEDFYKQSHAGHHKNYDNFDLEYLQNNFNQDATSNSLMNKLDDIKIQKADSSNRYNIGYENNPLEMPVVNKNFKSQNIETDTQFMTDVSNAPLKDKFAKVKNTISRLFSDRYVDVKPISKQANELLNLENQSNGTIDYILNKKLVSKEGDAITNKSFKDVLTMGDKKLQKEYEDYLLNKHNIDRYKEGKTLLANTEGIEITPEQSQQIISQYEQVYPQFKELANQYSTNWNSFSNEWLSDFVNKDTLKMLQEKYPSYVPSYRQQESFGTQLPTNRIVNGAKIKEATGSTKKIIPLNEQISEQISKIVKANRRNEAYKEMLKPVLENPEKFADKIEIVKIGTDKYANTTEREIAQQVLSLQDDVIAGEDSINSLIDVINNPVKQVQGRDGYLTVFDKGTPITVKIKDQNLFNALNKSQQTNNLSFLGKAWNKFVLTPFKGAITQYNPFFAVRNISRDLPSAYIQGAENNPIKFIGGRAKSAIDLTADFLNLKHDPLWDKYQALGGEMMNISSNPLAPNKIKGKVFDKVGFIPKKYSDLLGISEQFNRFAEFKKVFKDTGDVNKAKIAAANVTVNFGKGGELIKAIDKVIPYSNAAVQGTLKTIETFKDKPIQAISKAILSTTIPAAGFYYYNNSNKEKQKIYDEITTDVKNTNYIMVLGKDNIIKIPKTQQAGLLFASLGERLFDYFGKNDKEAFKGMPETFKKSFMPIDYKSGVVMPAINVAMGGNKDFFGRDIVPQSLQNMSPEQQYDEKSTTLSKFLGDKFGLSPKKVDYLLDSYAGVIYDIMKKSGDSKAKGGILSKGLAGITDTAKANFTINTDYGKTSSSYYDLVNKVKQDKADFNQSISKQKAQVEKEGLKINSSSGRAYLESLLNPKQIENNAKLKTLTKMINDQSEELQGSSTKERKKKIFEFFKQLEESKKKSSSELYYE